MIDYGKLTKIKNDGYISSLKSTSQTIKGLADSLVETNEGNIGDKINPRLSDIDSACDELINTINEYSKSLENIERKAYGMSQR